MAIRELGSKAGSLTWIARHGPYWWGCFSNYDGRGGTPGHDHRWTIIFRFDDRWEVRGRFALPAVVLSRIAPSGLSGGSWGADGRLYVKGHDRPEIYVLPPDSAGLLLEEALQGAIDGQAVAWDTPRPGLLWQIDGSRRTLLGYRVRIVRELRSSDARP